MRVAVISNTSKIGKSSFIFLLASIFARSQHRRVAIMSTSDMTNALDTVEVKAPVGKEGAMPVFKALLDAKQLEPAEIWEYGTRVGTEEVFAFNIMGSSMEENDLLSVNEVLLQQLESELTLIEITGDFESEVNMNVLENVDNIIYVTGMSLDCIRETKHYIETLPEDIVKRTGFLCQKFSYEIMNEKQFAKKLGISVRILMTLPYNVMIPKFEMEHKLNALADKIVAGQEDVIPLRIKLYEIMCYIFGEAGQHNRRGVKEVKDWYK